MTMPHLMNCPHSGEGWCLDCVKELYDEREQRPSALWVSEYPYAIYPVPSGYKNSEDVPLYYAVFTSPYDECFIGQGLRTWDEFWSRSWLKVEDSDEVA